LAPVIDMLTLDRIISNSGATVCSWHSAMIWASAPPPSAPASFEQAVARSLHTMRP
jgi:hypothetical protein